MKQCPFIGGFLRKTNPSSKTGRYNDVSWNDTPLKKSSSIVSKLLNKEFPNNGVAKFNEIKEAWEEAVEGTKNIETPTEANDTFKRLFIAAIKNKDMDANWPSGQGKKKKKKDKGNTNDNNNTISDSKILAYIKSKTKSIYKPVLSGSHPIQHMEWAEKLSEAILVMIKSGTDIPGRYSLGQFIEKHNKEDWYRDALKAKNSHDLFPYYKNLNDQWKRYQTKSEHVLTKENNNIKKIQKIEDTKNIKNIESANKPFEVFAAKLKKPNVILSQQTRLHEIKLILLFRVLSHLVLDEVDRVDPLMGDTGCQYRPGMINDVATFIRRAIKVSKLNRQEILEFASRYIQNHYSDFEKLKDIKNAPDYILKKYITNENDDNEYIDFLVLIAQKLNEISLLDLFNGKKSIEDFLVKEEFQKITMGNPKHTDNIDTKKKNKKSDTGKNKSTVQNLNITEQSLADYITLSFYATIASPSVLDCYGISIDYQPDEPFGNNTENTIRLALTGMSKCYMVAMARSLHNAIGEKNNKEKLEDLVKKESQTDKYYAIAKPQKVPQTLTGLIFQIIYLNEITIGNQKLASIPSYVGTRLAIMYACLRGRPIIINLKRLSYKEGCYNYIDGHVYEYKAKFDSITGGEFIYNPDSEKYNVVNDTDENKQEHKEDDNDDDKSPGIGLAFFSFILINENEDNTNFQPLCDRSNNNFKKTFSSLDILHIIMSSQIHHPAFTNSAVIPKGAGILPQKEDQKDKNTGSKNKTEKEMDVLQQYAYGQITSYREKIRSIPYKKISPLDYKKRKFKILPDNHLKEEFKDYLITSQLLPNTNYSIKDKENDEIYTRICSESIPYTACHIYASSALQESRLNAYIYKHFKKQQNKTMQALIEPKDYLLKGKKYIPFHENIYLAQLKQKLETLKKYIKEIKNSDLKSDLGLFTSSIDNQLKQNHTEDALLQLALTQSVAEYYRSFDDEYLPDNTNEDPDDDLTPEEREKFMKGEVGYEQLARHGYKVTGISGHENNCLLRLLLSHTIGEELIEEQVTKLKKYLKDNNVINDIKDQIDITDSNVINALQSSSFITNMPKRLRVLNWVTRGQQYTFMWSQEIILNEKDSNNTLMRGLFTWHHFSLLEPINEMDENVEFGEWHNIKADNDTEEKIDENNDEEE